MQRLAGYWVMRGIKLGSEKSDSSSRRSLSRSRIVAPKKGIDPPLYPHD